MSTASLTEELENISRKLQSLRKKRTPHRKIYSPIEWSPTATGDFPDVSWPEWQTHLAKRAIPVEIAELFPSHKKTSVLLWGVGDALYESGTVDLVDSLYRVCRSKHTRKLADMRLVDKACDVEAWVTASKSREADVGLALECLALAHALPRLATALDPEDWWGLLRCLVHLSVDSCGLSLDKQPLSHQLMAGELALTLHFSFPEIGFQQALSRQARKELTRGLLDLLDGEGLPHARHLSLLRPLLACWTRAYSIGEAIGKHALQRDARVQYEWLVRQSIRLTRGDGTQALSDRAAGNWCPELFDVALDHSDDPDNAEAARMALHGVRSKHRAGRFTELPEPVVHSEWAEVSVLRTSWKPNGEKLTISHANRTVYGELEASGTVVWSGPWEPHLMADGQPIRPSDDWEVVCWFTDDDGDYLELEATCDNDFVFQRQFFLARRDRFLYVADAVIGSRSCHLEYDCQLNLGPDVSYSPDPEASEGFLVTGRGQPVAHCFPLALPEWPDHRVGMLAGSDGCLQLHQQAQARRLYAPIWFDLDPRRMGKPITWRQLTVAEQLERVSEEQAVGYRVQVGKKHWLVYRTLSPRANRTILGQNLSSDCLIARFRRDGTTETLVEIE